MLKLNARQLRTSEPSEEQIKSVQKQPIYIILDNVLDTYNIGSIFRLADAVAVQKLYLCGETLTPPNPRIKKASISTWKWVEWEYCKSAVIALLQLRAQSPGLKAVAVEQDPRSHRLDQVKYELPLALIVGNETYGVSKEVLDLADSIVELPMWGINRSLNVMVSLGIILYKVAEQYVSFSSGERFGAIKV